MYGWRMLVGCIWVDLWRNLVLHSFCQQLSGWRFLLSFVIIVKEWSEHIFFPLCWTLLQRDLSSTQHVQLFSQSLQSLDPFYCVKNIALFFAHSCVTVLKPVKIIFRSYVTPKENKSGVTFCIKKPINSMICKCILWRLDIFLSGSSYHNTISIISYKKMANIWSVNYLYIIVLFVLLCVR